jgi:phosphatidylserine/phosphatidylglycerophosphate/cardiolipin synthase-like enzyme
LNHKNSEERSDSFSEKNSLSEEEIEIPTIISNEGHYWNGKDYSNIYKADFKDIADFSSDQYDRKETPRMPWRDEALVIFGESARDCARHFIQRWNQCKKEKIKNIDSYQFLLPKKYSENFNYNHYLSWPNNQMFKCDIQLKILMKIKL